jgi:predicted DNA-binding antitoxin AbrB/MazE fold protein
VMTITVAAVYEGGGVLKLERPVDLKENAKVNVIIETEPATLAASDDPTGWKAIDALRGIVKGARPRTWPSNTTSTSTVARVIFGACGGGLRT